VVREDGRGAQEERPQRKGNKELVKSLKKQVLTFGLMLAFSVLV